MLLMKELTPDEEALRQQLGRWIDAFIHRKGWNYADLSRATGIPGSKLTYVTRTHGGRRELPTVMQLKALYDAGLDVNLAFERPPTDRELPGQASPDAPRRKRRASGGGG